jgi:heme/copper-type cytochrome/quinol oxidase subunit 2
MRARYASLATISMALVSLVANAAAPNISVTPQPFAGSQALVQLLDYAMYAAWLFVIGLIIYAVFEMREGALSPGVKKALGGAIAAAFLLTFGWAIISGVF